jgi:toxin YoeB
MRSVKFEPKAFNQIDDWLPEDRKMFQRILRILKECQRTPFEGVAKRASTRLHLTLKVSYICF